MKLVLTVGPHVHFVRGIKSGKSLALRLASAEEAINLGVKITDPLRYRTNWIKTYRLRSHGRKLKWTEFTIERSDDYSWVEETEKPVRVPRPFGPRQKRGRPVAGRNTRVIRISDSAWAWLQEQAKARGLAHAGALIERWARETGV